MAKSAFSTIGQPLSDDDRLDIKAWMEKRQRQVDAQGQPIRRGDKAALVGDGVTGILFNEMRSFSGPKAPDAYLLVAHTVINGDETWGADRARYARTASTVAKPAEAERETYAAMAAAVAKAREQRAQGIDPTDGAVHFRFTTEPDRSSFGGRSLKAQLPVHNSFTQGDVPSSSAFVNIY